MGMQIGRGSRSLRQLIALLPAQPARDSRRRAWAACKSGLLASAGLDELIELGIVERLPPFGSPGAFVVTSFGARLNDFAWLASGATAERRDSQGQECRPRSRRWAKVSAPLRSLWN